MRVSPRARAHPRRRTAVAVRVVTAAAAVSLATAACGTAPATDPQAAPTASEQSGNFIRLPKPLPKPEVTLTDQQGRSFDLTERTAGRPTLLTFGYTHCPDVCPTTMADIANAVKKLPEADQERLQVVFVTTDPGRDTAERLNEWLAAFDARFIGLTGDFDDIEKAASGVGISVEKPVETDGDYEVSHGGQVLAFSAADDAAHTIYTSGATGELYEADLPKLMKGEL